MLEGLHEDHMGPVRHALEGEEWKMMSGGNTGPIRSGLVGHYRDFFFFSPSE